MESPGTSSPGRTPVAAADQPLHHRVAERALRLATRRAAPRTRTFRERSFARGRKSAEVFFDRFQGHLRFEGKDVLDMGCGAGAGAFTMARLGARSVLGVDISAPSIEFAQEKLRGEYADLADRVAFERTDTLDDLAGRSFDLIVSKDSFEHFADPDTIVAQLKRLLRPDGVLAIGFGPLWKSPYGGHLGYMTKLPWVHLVMPEEVVMRERGRHTPEGEQWDGAMTYEEGGLNRMTLERMHQVMAASGLQPVYLATNVHDSTPKRVVGQLSRVPGLEEYFTFNVYSLWRAPAPQSGRG